MTYMLDASLSSLVESLSFLTDILSILGTLVIGALLAVIFLNIKAALIRRKAERLWRKHNGPHERS